MELTYNYCECCLKPVKSSHQDSYAFCSECSSRLLKKIYGEEKDSKK